MHSQGKRGKTLYGHFLILLLILLGVNATAVAAQEGQSDLTEADQEEETPVPVREAERTAPERDAKILRQATNPDGATNTIIQIPAEADTYLASERPNQNFGADSLFLGYNLAGQDNFGAERVLLRFDVAGNLPDNAVINDAYIRLYLNFSSPDNDDPMGTALRRLASPWDEYTVTWNTEPAWTDVDDVIDVGSSDGWYRWQITDLASEWYDSSFANNGVAIIGDETVQQRERAFYSRETTTGFFPQLVIDYDDVNDTQPPQITVDDLPAYSPRSFTVSWSGDDQGSAGIDYYDVRYRVDGGAWMMWREGITDTSAEFNMGDNGRLYEFEARGVDNVGNVESFIGPEAETTVDNRPPQTMVDPLPALTNDTTFTLGWSGDDGDGSGIDYYDVQYRYQNGPWIWWQQQTIATSAQFTASSGDGLYAFEARAADELGQIEQFTDQREAAIIVDNEPPFVEPQVWLPLALASE